MKDPMIESVPAHLRTEFLSVALEKDKDAPAR